MRPYGVRVVEWPDIADIIAEGAKSSIGNVRSKSGEFRAFGTPEKRASTRRYWKRQARRVGVEECRAGLRESE